MFIKKIFQNKTDESVHKQFVRFGKGTYEMRAVINAHISSSQVKISSGFEFANDLVEFCLSINSKLEVSGIILSKNKLEIEGLEKEKKKKSIFEYSINKEIESGQLKIILEKCHFALLDCKGPGIELKIKKKLPKPGKSNKAKVKDNFCVLKLDLKFSNKFKEEFFWDAPSFKKARAEHAYYIKETIIPKELGKEKDYEKIRLSAKRKGKITRKTIVDKKEVVKEKEFIA